MKQFAGAREGSITLMMALAMMAVVGSVGVAVDVGRAQFVRAKLQNAVDAAGLAAGATLNSADLNAVTTKYVNVNFVGGNQSAVITNVLTALSADSQTLTITVSATMPTTFMQIFGKTSLDMTATTEITRASKGMELVLVLDNTGSMNSAVNPAVSNVSKLSAVKTAITGTGGLLEILYGASNNTADKLWVGVVPFSQAVNIGTGTAWVNANAYDWGVPLHAWKGCVMARSAPYDTSDDPPSVAKFDAYYALTTGTVTAPVSGTGVSGSCSGGLNAWKCTVLSSGKNKLTYDYSHSNSLGDNKGPNTLCPEQVTPMIAEKDTVATAVNGMVAAGSTFINTGMAWGQRMLSPKWRGIWGGQMDANSLPLDYHANQMNKVLVLMTDGMNSFSSGNFTNYGFLSDNQLGTTKTMNNGDAYNVSAEKVLNDRTLAICSALKANGVIIYTIGFGKDDLNNFASSTSVNGPLLKSCASAPDYYFLAPTNAQLQTVFQTIGDSLSNLRISK